MDFIYAAAKCKNMCPEGLNWPGWLAGISEGAHGISKYFFRCHFKPKMVISRLKILVSYSSCFRWCDLFSLHVYLAPESM